MTLHIWKHCAKKMTPLLYQRYYVKAHNDEWQGPSERPVAYLGGEALGHALPPPLLIPPFSKKNNKINGAKWLK